jgi:threonine aldolase
LLKIDPLEIDMQTVQTNMVFAGISRLLCNAAELNRRLGRYNVEVSETSSRRIRMVTHRHITPEHVDYAIEAFKEVVSRA